jgi:hypothetical protein
MDYLKNDDARRQQPYRRFFEATGLTEGIVLSGEPRLTDPIFGLVDVALSKGARMPDGLGASLLRALHHFSIRSPSAPVASDAARASSSCIASDLWSPAEQRGDTLGESSRV